MWARGISDDRQARLEKAGSVSFKGDSERRRTGSGKTDNKAAGSECRNTDDFKAQIPNLAFKEKEAEQ